MSASNTKDCVRDLIGKRVAGVLFDALPSNRRDLQAGNKTLIFDDGSGFTFSNKGTFWKEEAEDIRRAVALKESELRTVERDIQDVLIAAGVNTEGETR